MIIFERDIKDIKFTDSNIQFSATVIAFREIFTKKNRTIIISNALQ